VAGRGIKALCRVTLIYEILYCFHRVKISRYRPSEEGRVVLTGLHGQDPTRIIFQHLVRSSESLAEVACSKRFAETVSLAYRKPADGDAVHAIQDSSQGLSRGLFVTTLT
jgi:hypothetical protein